jgi:hypothetical protein
MRSGPNLINQRSWKVTIRKLKSGYMVYIGYKATRCTTFAETVDMAKEHFGEK